MAIIPEARDNKLLQCWGKTNSTSTDVSVYHPAIYHMLDVGNVAQVILEKQSSPRWKKILSDLFSFSGDELSKWLPFFIAIHDMGKISASFQRLNKDQLSRLKNAGFTFGREQDLAHTEISRNFIWYEWPKNSSCEISEPFRKVIREVVGGHHG